MKEQTMNRASTFQNFRNPAKNYFPRYQKVIVREQDYSPTQLIVHTTQLKMQDKEVVIQSPCGREFSV